MISNPRPDRAFLQNASFPNPTAPGTDAMRRLQSVNLGKRLCDTLQSATTYHNGHGGARGIEVT
jgi:hypothetical protein